MSRALFLVWSSDPRQALLANQYASESMVARMAASEPGSPDYEKAKAHRNYLIKLRIEQSKRLGESNAKS